MFEEVLAGQNPHWTGDRYETGVRRACFSRLVEYVGTGQVVAVIGVRRAGKSTLIKQFINDLVESQGVTKNNVLFLNLEHPYLSPYREDPTTLQRLYEDYLKMMQPEGEVFVCLDEVQFFRQWPVFVKAHHETKKIRFLVTGSNAAMLSSDMMTLLSGRSLPLEVFPFSFREMADARGIEVDDPAVRAGTAPKLKLLLEEILEFGGFPTVALHAQNQTAFDILGAHARTVLLQDVVPRLGLRKPEDLEKLYVYLVTNIGKLFSYHQLTKLFGLSDKSIKEYLRALCEAHLVYELDQFSFSLKKQIRNPKKIYSIDTGQANAMGFKFSSNRGRLLENLIFIDLMRLGLEVFYFHSDGGSEVDFVVKNGTDLSLVQVCWDLNSPDTRTREIKALKEAMNEVTCKSAIVIVGEVPLSLELLDNEITLIPAYQYLAMEPSKRKVLF